MSDIFYNMPGTLVSKSYEEISKLGPPKASGYVWSPVDSTTRAPKERKSQGSYWYKGKSLILRRPKYEFAVLPKFKKGDDYDNTYFTRQKYKGGGKEFHAAHTSGKKLNINGVDYKNVSKAFTSTPVGKAFLKPMAIAKPRAIMKPLAPKVAKPLTPPKPKAAKP